MRSFLSSFLLLSLLACGDKGDDTGVVRDKDKDGFQSPADCNDDDPAINPDATEVCDEVDNDCDGYMDGHHAVDAPIWFADLDEDGFGDPFYPRPDCVQPEGHVDNDQDCDDFDEDIRPGGTEVCDEVDNDCNGEVDEASASAPAWYRDADEDGFGDELDVQHACIAPDGYVSNRSDCDDTDASINPEAAESWYDGIDQDCDDDSDYDQDGDGLDSDTYGGEDCDDTDASIRPGLTEHCDNVDEDCDGEVDEDPIIAPTYFLDADGDGHGVPDVRIRACEPPEGYADNATDCDDTDASISPSATETWYNGIDQDCSGGSDYDRDGDGFDHINHGGDDCADNDPTRYPRTWYHDADRDGYGDPTDSQYSCPTPARHVLDSSDCDDTRASVNPGELEVCGDGLDNDCDGLGTGCGLMGEIADEDAYSTLYGDSTNDQAGEAVCLPGDIDGDGLIDLLVGAPDDALGGPTASGSVYLVLGVPSGIRSLTGGAAILSGDDSDARVGTSLAGLLDVDGDGYDELAVGAPGADGTGAAYLVQGPVTGILDLSAAASATFSGASSGDEAAMALASLEISGDGVEDLLVWSPGAANLYGLSGDSTGSMALSAGFLSISGLGTTVAPVSLSSAGDVDGDGQEDLLVGASGASSSRGTAYLFLGPLTGSLSTGEADASWTGLASSDLLGSAVAGVGDIDEDGLDDFLLGAPGSDAGASSGGSSYLLLGSTWTTTSSLSSAQARLSGGSGDVSGEALTGADVDADDVPDLIIGAPQAGAGGAVYIVVGPVSGTIALATEADGIISASHAADNFGYAIDAGDVDDDGIEDLLIGSPLYNRSTTINAGAAFLLLGGEGL